ncbi:MAG TPA: hypothetical protein PLF26_10445 [Blastocatellia bacterium]|nr:hypothetical protein [Blastocatellia bacterium]
MQYAPCPNCQDTNATQVSFTWWGGLVGPRMLSHVKCSRCATAYNGKTGKSNTMGIALYVGVSVALLVLIGLSYALQR